MNRVIFGTFGAFVALSAQPAYAKITVKPVNVSADVNVEVKNAVVHIAAIYSNTVTAFSGGFIDPMLPTIDLSKGFFDEANGARQSMIVFDVSSDAPPTPGLGQQLGLVIEAQGTTATAVPLAAAGFADLNYTQLTLPSCNGGGAACYSQSTTTTGYFFAIPFTAGRTMRVGFYPKDACFAGTSNNLNGCDGSAVEGTYPITLNLKFSVRVTTATAHAAAGGEDASEAIAMIFHKDVASSCSTGSVDSLYTPADGGIYFYPDRIVATAASAGAPLHSIYFVANEAPTLAVGGENSRSNNAVVGTPAWGSTGALISGFQNATAASGYTAPAYNAAVSVRDAAGLVTTMATCADGTLPVCGSCLTMPNDITTRDIRGFIEGRNCFISSTAFGIDSVWTNAFRKFRSDVLLKTRLGQWVTSKYYSWSPAGAAWLEGHAWARFAVAVLLFPLALLVWIWVHVGTVGMVGFVAVGGLVWRSRRYSPY